LLDRDTYGALYSPAKERRDSVVRIAMDGSFLRLPPSGTAAYVCGLQAGLYDLHAGVDLRLLDPEWPEKVECSRGAPARLTASARTLWSDDRFERARWEWFGVARDAKRHRADLLHIPHFSAPVRSPMPFVVTIHDVIPLVLPEYRASRSMQAHLAIVSRTVKCARLILTPSQAAANDITRVLGIAPSKIRVTPEAAGERYVPSPDRSAAKRQVECFGIDGPFVFNVGGLDSRKNLPVLLEAFAMARPELPNGTKIVIAGAAHTPNTTVYPPLEPTVARLGLKADVRLLGRISEEDKLLLYQAAELYVTPSSYEGFGLTALEAMSCGVPTIAAKRTSLPEVVGDGGLLVEPEPAKIARAMVDVLTSAGMSASLRASGIERAKQFTWRRTADLTLTAYQEALAEPNGGR
jgi:glycosyltransferase involved in cell wall biosynthesis